MGDTTQEEADHETIDKDKITLAPDQVALGDLFQAFCQGTVLCYGPYLDHLLGYSKQSCNNRKVFFITYEELKELGPSEACEKISELLGAGARGGGGEGRRVEVQL
ncbi:hypothetical protein H6P81_014679 [Aristolochia fimbriata]|uniref:Sulfotransferase n=1 Tax=Aristolochia fimbriata TaxID=158543 RepID=A0AAV7E481_ARIFI|nr:hypothetical protein H6P81_014679 [Aristolochia fimbriata]